MTGIKQNRIAHVAGMVLCLLLAIPSAALAKSVQAVVSVAPLAWLVEQVAGDNAEVETLVADGRVPESSQPSPHSQARLPGAGLIVLVGHPSFTFESRFVQPQLSDLQRSEAVDLYRIAVSLYGAAAIDRGDPHLWTSPRVMQAAASQLAGRMAKLDPRHTAVYQQRSASLQRRIDDVIVRFRDISEQRSSKRFLVYHPAWGGLARDIGLQQIAIEQEGKSPGPARLARLIGDMAQSGDTVIITSPGHAQRDAQVLASQHHLTIEVVDPLMKDWFEMMHKMMNALDTSSD